MKNLIQSSIEEIDPDSITRSSSIHSIPLIFIRDLNELENLISENDYAYLTAINFKGIYGEKAILPRPDGKIGKVIVCCNPERIHHPTFLIGNEISKLPAGVYSLKNFPDNSNIKELYSEGLDMIINGNRRGAYQNFKSIIASSPLYLIKASGCPISSSVSHSG